MVTRTVWAIVRQSPDGHEFILTAEIGTTYAEAIDRENITRATVSNWHVNNKVRRVVRFTMTEES